MNHKLLKVFGYIVSAICLFFIVRYMIRLDIDFGKISIKNIILIISLALPVYLVNYFGVIFVYKKFLNIFNDFAPLNKIFILYSKSNLGKYIPGNVAHITARNILGNTLGIKHSELLTSTTIEIGLNTIVVIGLMLIISLIGSIPIDERIIEMITDRNWIVLIVLGVGIAIAVGLFIWKKDLIIGLLKKIVEKKGIGTILLAGFIYTVIFIINGFVLYVVIMLLSPEIESYVFRLFMMTLNAYIISWLLGYVTPGAPGGIGVREAVMLLLLSPVFNEDTVVLAAVLSRAIAVVGDILLFLIAFVYQKAKGIEFAALPGDKSE